VERNPSSFALELDRAILILKRGFKENWKNRDQYLTAFEKTPDTDSTGRRVTDAKEYVKCALGSHLRIHQIWDEGAPIEVEVDRTICAFTNMRKEAIQADTAKVGSPNSEGQAAEFHLASCSISQPRKVAVSAGVAAGMLKTKVDPIYPTEALEDHIFGTVVLHATISTEGHVEELRVISGPTSLQNAALATARLWIYRPYLLNNIPVEVETTINIVFEPSR
jgi:TonB family protein